VLDSPAEAHHDGWTGHRHRSRLFDVVTSYGLLSLADHLPDPVTGESITQAERFQRIVETAVRAEQAGFERVGIGEHHFGHYILPSPFVLLGAIAARTRTMRLGTSVTLLAGLDPVRVAEDLVTLDALSNGRAELTAARGVEAVTQAAFGIADADELRARFDENLRLLQRLLGEERVTWSGRFRTPLHDVRLEPRPVQTPHPPLWMGGGLSTISCDLAVELALPLSLPSLFCFPEDYLPILERYRGGMTAAGHAGKISVAYPSYVHVARTSQEARARFRPYFENYRSAASTCRGGQGRSLDYDTQLEGAMLCGSPAEVVDKIKRVDALLGLQHHYLMPDFGGLSARLLDESMALLVNDVLPHLL
jgi:alkanesulfonate monooxygenase SsuD/methylene tetrahydromethanopterin reductase-like flavin-dependent oxidoreductase (luciferase family)